jgi:hypothetical protein
MHRPFTPVPSWLDSERRGIEDPLLFPSPGSLEFLLISFEALYGLGMSDRQVVELTALLICLSKDNKFHIPLNENTSFSTNWYLNGSRFFLCCSNLGEKVQRWVEANLPKSDLRSGSSQAFWSESRNWPGFFFQDLEEFGKVVQKTRNRFVQQFFRLPDTGIWDGRAVEVAKRFQVGFPRSLLPWKNGTLDGFTYKFLARSWRKRKGMLV